MSSQHQAAEAGLEQRLTELLEPVVRSEGLMLVELVWQREVGGQVLRLYVDRAGGGQARIRFKSREKIGEGGR